MYSEENVDDSTSLNCYVVLDIVDDIHRESSTMELSNFYFYVVVRTKSEFPAQSPFISSVHFWVTNWCSRGTIVKITGTIVKITGHYRKYVEVVPATCVENIHHDMRISRVLTCELALS